MLTWSALNLCPFRAQVCLPCPSAISSTGSRSHLQISLQQTSPYQAVGMKKGVDSARQLLSKYDGVIDDKQNTM